MRRLLASSVVALVATMSSPAVPIVVAQEPVEYEVVRVFPHDPDAYTQGLAFRGAALFEGTGLEGESTLRKVRLRSGEVLRKVDLAPDQFGEGITLLDGKVYQLTWTSGIAYVYRSKTFERIRQFAYEGEGWGLTDNGRRLIMSDGSDVIRFRDPGSFEVKREIHVTHDGEPVHSLNELEWINGEIFANVFLTDYIVRIDPRTGLVTDSFDIAALHQAEEATGDPEATNGIAYIKDQDRLFVTGKNWAHLYEIRLTE